MTLAELALDRRDTARFRHNMLTHGMSSTVGCFALNLSASTDAFPDLVDGEHGETTRAMGHR